ncbi:MAG TPA: alpha/beta hydrolase domain-containing protein [Alphaproteobacteria bacterium]|nr:alpha/beta hydrolase domain-containing protein [Alphaproteobacteria bacterium]
MKYGKAFCVLFCLAAMSRLPALSAEEPSLTGPIAGGAHGRPFTSSLADLSAAGYVEQEYFIEGTASAYRSDRPLTPDGRWSVSPSRRAPFKTRILVRRPRDPKKFNGTVVVEWLNVSGGFDVDAEWGYAYPELMREGFVWIGVSAQHAGVMGPPLRPGFSQPLTLWDAARYGSLSVPDDDFSYDIFSQAARAVGPHRGKSSVDPLDGLAPARLIGVGVSQSANRLTTYVDAVQPLARVLDGILIGSRIGARGGAAPLAADVQMPDLVRIRDDLKVPVFVIETESDVATEAAARTPDSAKFRLWELAGTAHQNKWADDYFGAEIKRDLGAAGLGGCNSPVNDLPTQHVADAAIHLLDVWVRTGKAPPTAPLVSVSVDNAQHAVTIERDKAGNALGGLRLPELAVAAARYAGVGDPPDRCRLDGVAIPFDEATLKALYPTHEIYVAKVKAAVEAAEKAGYLLQPEGAEEIAKAKGAAIP